MKNVYAEEKDFDLKTTVCIIALSGISNRHTVRPTLDPGHSFPV